MSFASTTELAALLKDSALEDDETAQLVLDIATSDIRTHCGWSISAEEVTEQILDGTGDCSLWLPTLALTAVTAVVVNNRTLAVGVDFDWTRYGRLERYNGHWPRTPRSVTVSYSHGYDPVPDTVKGVCLALAARKLSNPEGARARTEGAGPFSESVSYLATGATLDVIELERLATFVIEHVG